MTPRPAKSRCGRCRFAYAGAYDVQFDDVKYAWGADMSTDLVQRLNVETDEWSSYLLPTSINTRHIDVQKSSDPHVLSSMWTEGQQNGQDCPYRAAYAVGAFEAFFGWG